MQIARAEPKELIFDNESRKRMQAGINKLADAVGVRTCIDVLACAACFWSTCTCSANFCNVLGLNALFLLGSIQGGSDGSQQTACQQHQLPRQARVQYGHECMDKITVDLPALYQLHSYTRPTSYQSAW